MNKSLQKTLNSIIKLMPVVLGCLLSSAGFSQIQVVSAPKQSQIQAEVLRVHNKLRAKHQAPDLVWDNELQNFAIRHAQTCVFKHSFPRVYGENLASGYPTVAAAILAWYVEGAQYSYQQPGYAHSTGHFTQLIWVGSKKIGCGLVTCNGKNNTPGNYLVCEYSPAGNVTNPGYFEKNVLPVKE